VTVSRPYQIALAATFVVLALAIVGLWKVGPVVAVLTPTHGVHAGDALAAVPGLGALWLVGHPLPFARSLRARSLRARPLPLAAEAHRRPRAVAPLTRRRDRLRDSAPRAARSA
jgi:hypothetical protein